MKDSKETNQLREIEVAGTEMRHKGPWNRWCAACTCGLPGIALCLAIALVAYLLGGLWPIVGGPVFAILLGLFIRNVLPVPEATLPGIAFCSKKMLQYSIILLGGGLSLLTIYSTGAQSLVVMLVTLLAALVCAWIIGRLLRVNAILTSLVGVGTGICGGSAIAAIAPIVKAEDDDIAFAISTVFLFNVVAVVAFPFFGHLMGMSDLGFGIWAGTAINDTSSVVAAAGSYSHEALEIATVTKLARTLMIVPIALFFALLVGARRDGGEFHFIRVFPWFILGFLAMALLNTAGILGETLSGLSSQSGKFLITVALAGVGLGANMSRIIKTGYRPIVLGMCVWILIALTSIGVQTLLNRM